MKKKFFIGLFIFALIGFICFVHILFGHKSKQQQNNIVAPIEISDESIVKFKEAPSTKPVVVMFYVDWCTFCRRFMPIYVEAAKKYSDDFTFAVVNCEEAGNEQLVESYAIMGYPSLFIVDNDLDFSYGINTYSTRDLKTFSEELDKHIKLKSKFKK